MDKNKDIELKGEEVIENKSEMVETNVTKVTETADNGRKKIKEEKLPTKIVVRRLPPTMSEENFKDQVSPLPAFDYFYYVQEESIGPFSFSRAYINFINQEDLYNFTKTFDNYVFLDSKGQEYPAIVEFAPFQRICKPKSKKRDQLSGTIENDPVYIAFKENLQAEASENPKASAIAKQHYFETDLTTTKEVSTTPLLEFLKQRRADKNRAREERKEERKRKDMEKKMKLKFKNKSEEDLESKDIQILQPKEKPDENVPKKKEDRSPKDLRTREFKSRGKNYQEDKRYDEPREYKRRNYKDDKKDEESQEASIDGRRKFIDKKKKFEKKNYYDDDLDKRRNDKFRKVKKESERDRKRKEIWLKKVTERKTAQAKTETDNVKQDKEIKRRHSFDLSDTQKTDIVSKRRNSFDLKNTENIVVTFTENKNSKKPITQKDEQGKDLKNENRGRENEFSPRAKKNEETNSKRKDPRTDRRIRNKDRPSIEIYRPGMGKFSKQRIEKEKVMKSSPEVDSPPQSPSPTDKNQS